MKRRSEKGCKKKQAIIEVVVDEHQSFQPKVPSSTDNQGKFKSDNLFDMSPKIDKSILDRIMLLPEKLK